MRVLFIGGTGNISTSCTRRALGKGMEVFHLNRGNNPEKAPAGVVTLKADIRSPDTVKKALSGLRFDSVVQFIGFRPEQVEADLEVFKGNTGQYVFISSASAYRKPLPHPVITESTPLANPYWEYSRLKIACEDRLVRAWREGFPCTIVRPSHTYDDGWIPSGFGSKDFTVAHRILAGKELVVQGDGQSLWTLTHALDFAKGFVGLLGNPAAIGEAFQITSDESLTWDTIYHTLGTALGVEPRLVHIPSEFIARVNPEKGAGFLGDKAMSVIFDNSKIKRLVPDFQATIGFAEGVRRSLAWYEARPELKVADPVVEKEIDQILDLWKKAMRVFD